MKESVHYLSEGLHTMFSLRESQFNLECWSWHFENWKSRGELQGEIRREREVHLVHEEKLFDHDSRCHPVKLLKKLRARRVSDSLSCVMSGRHYHKCCSLWPKGAHVVTLMTLREIWKERNWNENASIHNVQYKRYFFSPFFFKSQQRSDQTLVSH